uniref:element excision factor XisH family protein n=1 Tax=Okeania sp. SIO2F4 TaxID=2607790 RepID=UPI0025E9263A|nr:element excision factor XisH family protein [Okeania sp. SIO2F4]
MTDDPYTLEYKGLRLYADLGAEKLLAAERAEQKIAVEIKVFNSPSQVTELQKAIGKYNMYRTILPKNKGLKPLTRRGEKSGRLRSIS